jgi:hypothetical protein
MEAAAPREARSYLCRNHPEREGIGICVICKNVVCVECSTKIDGVNHCRTCLARRAGVAVARAPSRAGGVVQGALALLLTLGSVVLVAGGLLVWAAALGRGGRSAENKQRLEAVAGGLRQYRTDTGAFPTDVQGLEALIHDPDDLPPGKWHGPYIDASWEQDGKVVDVYGRELHYRVGKISAATSAGKTPTAWGPPSPIAAIGSAGEDGKWESDMAMGDFVDRTVPWAAAVGDDEIKTVR